MGSGRERRVLSEHRSKHITVNRGTIRSVRNLVGRILSSAWIGALIGRVFHDRIPYRGHRLSVLGIDPRAKARIFWKLHEKSEIQMVRKYLRQDSDVIELG